MSVVVITGSAGLIGSEAVEFFAAQGFDVVGIDNDLRQYFFGKDASTRWNNDRLKSNIKKFEPYNVDIRDDAAVAKIFKKYGKNISVVIHTAAQPSHDWAAKEPMTDFTVNANGTLVMLENTRKYCPEAVFEFTSTNKVYGDLPNQLPLEEKESRWEIKEDHPFFKGIDETMSIDQCKHSLFGASKVAADVLVQEYGRYFDMKTVCFRGGCLTGPKHSGAMLHGFLAYLMKCCVTGDKYTVFGYKAKQVRDNIHSYDLVNAFYHFFQSPRVAEVYNMGGGRGNSCSVLEAISICEELSGQKMNFDVSDENRIGDHIWYISDLTKFQKHYPRWTQKYSLKQTMEQIFEYNKEKWLKK